MTKVIALVFNFCKDISITQEIEDIVNFNLHSKGCDKQQNASDQGFDAILCDGGESSLGMPTVNWTVVFGQSNG